MGRLGVFYRLKAVNVPTHVDMSVFVNTRPVLKPFNLFYIHGRDFFSRKRNFLDTHNTAFQGYKLIDMARKIWNLGVKIFPGSFKTKLSRQILAADWLSGV